MDSGSNREEEPTSWDELYNINLMPSELFLKFRKEVQGIRVGLNMEVLFYIFSISLSHSKLITFRFRFNLTFNFFFLSNNIFTHVCCM